MDANDLYLLGGGGHAKVIIETARSQGLYVPRGIFDDRFQALNSTDVLGVPILGPITAETLDRFHVESAIIAIGHNHARRQIARLLGSKVEWATIIHPRAIIAADVHPGAGTVIFAGVITQPGACIGEHAVLNTACSVDHDCIVQDFAHVGPGSHLTGGVSVGEGAMLGAGSIVTPGNSIGAWSTIGAGGVVIRDVPDGVTAVGVPVRITRV